MPGLKHWAPVPDPPEKARPVGPPAPPIKPPPPWKLKRDAAGDPIDVQTTEDPAGIDPLIKAVMASCLVPMGARK